MPGQPMTAAELEALLRIALPPLKLALREGYLRLPRPNPIAAAIVIDELATAERIRGRLARHGWWN